MVHRLDYICMWFSGMCFLSLGAINGTYSAYLVVCGLVVDLWNNMDWSEFPGVTPPRRKCRFRAYELSEEMKLLQQRGWKSEWEFRQRMRQRQPHLPPLSEDFLQAKLLEPPRRIR